MNYPALRILRPHKRVVHCLDFSTNEGDWINGLRHHAHRHMRGGQFGNILGLCVDALPKSQILIQTDGEKPSLKLKYAFPSRVVSPYQREHGASVDLSTIMSVFDEVSSWNLFSGDKTRRPGVSVHLSADAHWDITAPPIVGEEYEITTTISSSGRQLGFLSLELRRPRDDFLLASGKHIKFLPMPGIGPKKVIPWDKVFGSSFAAPYLFSSLQKTVSSHTSKDNIHLEDSDAKLEQWLSCMEAFQEIDESSQVKLMSTKEHCNVMGTIHGGFQAVYAEAAARLDPSVVKGAPLLSISTEYISACRPGTMLLGTCRTSTNTVGQHVVQVAISNEKTGKVSSNSTLLFHNEK